MGDRTFTSYFISTKVFQFLDVENELQPDYLEEEVSLEDSDEIITLVYEQANGGKEDSVNEMLSNLEIPFDYEWDNGDEYQAGSCEYRYIKGKMIAREFDNTSDMVDTKEVFDLLKRSPSEAKLFLDNRIKQYGHLIPLSQCKLPSKERLLFLAAKNGYESIVKKLLTLNPDFNYKDEKNNETTLSMINHLNDKSIIAELKKSILVQNRKVDNNRDNSFSL